MTTRRTFLHLAAASAAIGQSVEEAFRGAPDDARLAESTREPSGDRPADHSLAASIVFEALARCARHAPPVPELERRLTAPDVFERGTAAFYLGAIGEPSATPALMAALGDADKHPRTLSALALARIGPAAMASEPRVGDALRGAARAGDTPAMNFQYARTAARLALGGVGAAAGVDDLIEALLADSEPDRTTAAWALGRMAPALAGNAAARQAVSRAASHDDPATRFFAARSLALIERGEADRDLGLVGAGGSKAPELLATLARAARVAGRANRESAALALARLAADGAKLFDPATPANDRSRVELLMGMGKWNRDAAPVYLLAIRRRIERGGGI